MNTSIISVIICTYNRADLLSVALQSLCDQKLEKMYYEVIVVDNNSTDQTRNVVENFTHLHANVRYCFEPCQGLSHARNRGLQVARGEYIAITDDDCKLPQEWLSVAVEVIKQYAPAVFGGGFSAFYNTQKPQWFKDAYGSYTLGDTSRALNTDETLFGGNCFFSRTILENVGRFDPTLGVSGKKLGYGEETAVQLLIRAKIPEQLFYYDPRLYVYHLVRHEKMSLRWIIRQCFVQGKYTHRLFHKNSPLPSYRIVTNRIIRVLLGFIKDISFNVFFRDRKKYPCFQNYYYEHSSEYISIFGKIYEIISYKIK